MDHTMKRFFSIGVFALVVCLQAFPASAESTFDRPNIVWIVGENLKLDLGCYGAQHVKTPHLDGLAKEGMRYTKVFATSPVCAPSRSAFFTGMYQTSSDTHNMRSHREDDYRLPEGVRPLTHRLKAVGYTTANIKTMNGEVVGSGKLDLNFVNEGKLYDTDRWEELPKNQPFFAQINTLEAEYDIYDRQTWRVPRVKWKGEDHHEKIADPDKVEPPPYYPDHPLVRLEWARYLNSISGMDKTVGKILKRLEADGLTENTIVMFFGDNGRIEPRGIHWCYDTGLHVPLIIRWPRGRTPPQERRYAFSARDRIDETVNRVRSVRGTRYHYIRNYFPDRHFASLNRYKEKCFPIKPLMREMYAKGELTGPPLELMNPRVSYEQLFDTEQDPHEIHNLVASDKQEHREALIGMRSALDTWIVETNDQGEFPEPEDVVKPFEKEMHDWFGTPPWHPYKPEKTP